MDDSDTNDAGVSSIGMNVRDLRKWRKMSLEGLAGQAGLSKGYLSKIENGHSALQKRETLVKIAKALRVSVADLVGTAYLTERPDHEAHGAIPDIRLALLSSTLNAPADQPSTRTIDVLRAETERIEEIREVCRDAEAAEALPSLLTDLHAVVGAGGDERLLALRSLVQATKSTSQLLKNLGAMDLAYVAADRGYQAAVLLDNPLYVAVANCSVAQALIGLGAYKRALAVAQEASELLRAPTGTEQVEVYGMTVLSSAFSGGLVGNDPTEALREAQDVAGHTPGTNAFWMNFSAANVDLWRIAVALEADDPVAAAEIAARIDPEAVPATRRVMFYIDRARALYALRGKDDDVLALLRRAEKLGATRTHNNVWAREIVGEMWHRARHDAGGRELRGLAHRMGIISAA